MNKPDKNEQWLLNGDCSICRRKNYCKKECTKYSRNRAAFIKSAIRSAVDEATGGTFSKILENSNGRLFDEIW